MVAQISVGLKLAIVAPRPATSLRPLCSADSIEFKRSIKANSGFLDYVEAKDNVVPRQYCRNVLAACIAVFDGNAPTMPTPEEQVE